MSAPMVQVRELAAWGFDDHEFRPIEAQPVSDVLRRRSMYVPASAIASSEWDHLRAFLGAQASRTDLHREMDGLEWSLDVVDLRLLLSFQRRLVFDPRISQQRIPSQDNSDDLIAWAFGPSQVPRYEIQRMDSRALHLRSANPNFQIQLGEQSPFLSVSCGSPFLEVAEFRSRWFLRDGYHRAYRLLCGGVSVVPAVVVKAKTSAELGATKPRFFGEEILLSDCPPKVTDFLEDRFTVTYFRPPVIKTLRLHVEESFAPEPHSGEQA